MRKIKGFVAFINENLKEDLLLEMMQEEFSEYTVEISYYLTRIYVELSDTNGKEIGDFSMEMEPFDGWIEAVTANIKNDYRRKGISSRALRVMDKFVKLCGYNGLYAPEYTNETGFKRSSLGASLWASLEAKGLARSVEEKDDENEITRTYYYIGNDI